MEEMGLDIGATLIVTNTDDGFILTKKTAKTVDGEWDEFIQNDGSYGDKDMYDWRKPGSREIW